MSINNAVEDLKFLLKRFNGAISLIPLLEQISNVDDWLKELVSQKDKAQKEISDAKMEAEKAWEQVKAAKAEANDIVGAAKSTASAKLEEAVKAGKEVVGNAVEEARRLKDEADRVVANVSKEALDWKSKVTQYRQEAEVAKTELDEVKKDLEKFKSRWR